MDANDPGFQLGRHPTPSSSRESSPAPKRQRRSFTPTSDDGDVVPAHTETPTPGNAPLIRQAVGFSWTPSIGTNVTTYQASVAPQPIVPYFLPGQAPPPPPQPKPIKPRAPRRKRGEQYSDQTTKFKLTTTAMTTTTTSPGSASMRLTPTSAGNASGASLSTAPSSLMPPVARRTFSFATADNIGTAAPQRGTKRPRKSTKKPVHDQQSTRPSPAATVQHARSSVERPGRAPAPQATPAPSGAPSRHSNASTIPSNGLAQHRPMRMVTLLIEDQRSGIPDPQLAEVKVPLRVADDPEDGFWADALEICNTLQAGPSRIDGPAKVFTMRGRFRQFFMRVDHFDQHQVQSAYLGVSKERTLNVFVEAPVPQGQLPRPPVVPPDARPVPDAGSERDASASPSAMFSRPTYSLVTREDQIERLAKSTYARPERVMSPVSETGSYGHSRRMSSPNARHRSARRNQYAGRRLLTPPIPGRLADTQEEQDEAIANYIRSHIENHPDWIDYMQSKSKPQRVSEMLKQYTFVDDLVRELIGRKTPSYWDGAPNCRVDKKHVWHVLKLDEAWGEVCEETMVLVRFYGKHGMRYEDARIVEMINDTSPPKGNTLDKFLSYLQCVDERFTREAFAGEI